MGHVRYLAFYLVCGLTASIAHIATVVALGQDPLLPSLGASGAISGVLGGYLLLYPKRAVRVLMLRTVVTVLWRRLLGGAWGRPRPTVGDYVAMTGARRRSDRRRMALMLAALTGSAATSRCSRQSCCSRAAQPPIR
jgi:hypothetical protein